MNKIPKGWGYELIFASTEEYCGKILFFERMNAKSSMHFHKTKDETWYVQTGRFILRYIDTDTAQVIEKVLNVGDVWRNPPLLPHQLEALEDNSSVLEVSTQDTVEDNYRVFAGDSQV
jgi:uncharacterized RmlC-like cupin family protein